MRSRFSAFVTGDEDYLLRTWDPETRPERLDLAETGIRFYRLDIIDTVAGGPLDQTGIVEFEAFYKGAAGALNGSAPLFAAKAGSGSIPPESFRAFKTEVELGFVEANTAGVICSSCTK